MRLSHGFVRGEALSCIYHGWSYGEAGTCLRIPAHPGLAPPNAIRVATREVREVDGIVWVATGKPVGSPLRLQGLVPLRSVAAQAGFAALGEAAEAEIGPGGLVETTRGAQPVGLLLAAQGDGQTLIHVLVLSDADPAGRIAASRAAEALRRRAEEIQRGGIAA